MFIINKNNINIDIIFKIRKELNNNDIKSLKLNIIKNKINIRANK